MSRSRRNTVRRLLAEGALCSFGSGAPDGALDALVNRLGEDAADQRRGYQRGDHPAPKDVESGNMPHNAHDRFPADLPHRESGIPVINIR